MPWAKATPELKAFLDEAMAPFGCQKKLVFGNPCYFVNDNMFAGLHGPSLFVRLSEEDREKALATVPGATPFEPTPGMTMKGYAVLPETLYGQSEALTEWLECSFRFAASLPPKEAKAKKARPARGK